MPEVRKRVELVREYRLASKRDATKRLADYPSLFGEIRQPDSNYVLIPLHSSEYRKYIPMAFFDKWHIANNSCAMLPNATLYNFGVLMSIMHMAWTRQICGRLTGRYRYSSNIVYNNFPWPEIVAGERKLRVEKAAQKILDARAKFPESTLADLYDTSTMPKVLVDAHKELDEAVDRCYRLQPFDSELGRLEYLFSLYRKYTEPLIAMSENKRRRKRN
jgi:hypothetical protein